LDPMKPSGAAARNPDLKRTRGSRGGHRGAEWAGAGGDSDPSSWAVMAAASRRMARMEDIFLFFFFFFRRSSDPK
jgi:hypothetical protein